MQVSLRKYFGLKEALLLLLGIVILFVIIRDINFGKTWHALGHVSLQMVAIFIFIKIGGYLLGNYRWKVFVDKVRKVSFTKLLPVYFTGMVLDNLIPGPGFGGEPIKAYYLGKMIKKGPSKCFATALMDSLVGSLSYIGFVVVAIAYFFLFIDIPIIRAALKVIIIAMIAGLTGFGYFYFRKGDHKFVDKVLRFIYHFRLFRALKQKFAKYEHFKVHVRNQFLEFKEMMRMLWNDKPRFLYAIFISFLIVITDFYATQILLAGFGVTLSFLKIMVVVTVSGFIGYYAGIPGGTGVAEGSMLLLFQVVGVVPEIAAAVTLISRIFFYVMTYGMGYLSLVYVNIVHMKGVSWI